MSRSLELSKNDILNVFEENFGYSRVETPLGYAVKMTSRDAFIFCNVTGAGYLDNYVFPFTPKGLMKLFYNAFDYNFVTGVFDKTTLKNTPFILSKAKPFLFDTPYKYIVPIEFSKDIELQKFLENKFDELSNPSEFIIMRIEKNKKGNGLESFMEYLASEYFKKHGFIVENQIPLAYSVGSPDFGGYSVESIISSTKSYLPHGFHIIELSMLRLKYKGIIYESCRENNNTFIVGEAKTSTKIMDAQLKKYLDTGLYDWGIELHPNKQHASNSDRGMFTLDSNYKISYTPPSRKYIVNSPLYDKKEYGEWLSNYMKFYLVANFTNDEFCDFYQKKTGRIIDGESSIVEFIKSISASEIVEELKYI